METLASLQDFSGILGLLELLNSNAALGLPQWSSG